jgi:hypothetical protein
VRGGRGFPTEVSGLSWDLCLARRAATVAAVAVLLSLLVVAAADAGDPWPLRLCLTAARAPLAGAITGDLAGDPHPVGC